MSGGGVKEGRDESRWETRHISKKRVEEQQQARIKLTG